MIKIISQIRKLLENDATHTYPDLKLNQFKELPEGYYYDFSIRDSRFCIILQDLKYFPKINWILFRDLTIDEKSYWKKKYIFKLEEDEIKYTRSTLKIGEILDEDAIKFVMSRQVMTLRIFAQDLKWIIRMEEGRER